MAAPGAQTAANRTAIVPSCRQAWESSSPHLVSRSRCMGSVGHTRPCHIVQHVQSASGLAFWPRTVVSSRRAPPSGAVCAPRAGLVQKVSAKELDQFLASKRSQPLVIDFYATWCGPCIYLAKQLDTLAEQYGDNVRFLKVDTEEEYELAQQMKIRALPTMVFVSPDSEKLAIRVEGLLMSRVISDIIEKEL